MGGGDRPQLLSLGREPVRVRRSPTLDLSIQGKTKGGNRGKSGEGNNLMGGLIYDISGEDHEEIPGTGTRSQRQTKMKIAKLILAALATAAIANMAHAKSRKTWVAAKQVVFATLWRTGVLRGSLCPPQQLADRFEAWELPPWQEAAILPLRRTSELRDPKIRKRVLVLTEGGDGPNLPFA
jgi:hypothetical protein